MKLWHFHLTDTISTLIFCVPFSHPENAPIGAVRLASPWSVAHLALATGLLTEILFQSFRNAQTFANEMAWRTANAGKDWQRAVWNADALCHSFTYRLADIQDVNQLALEAERSPRIISQRYRELAAAEREPALVALNPNAGENTTPLEAGR